MNAWHPLVEPLTAAVIHEGDDVVVPRNAVASVVAQASGLPADDKHLVALHLAGFAKMLWNARGKLRVDDAIEALAAACVQLLGDARRASDVLVKAGLSAVGVAIGARTDVVAPRASDVARPAAAVKAARGLRRS